MSESASTESNPDGLDPIHTGDLGYASLWVPDVAKATEFYGTVLGWAFEPGSSAHGRQVSNTSVSQGVAGGQAHPTTMLCYAVDDIDAAVERVRAAGGTADEPQGAPYGRVASGVDDVGLDFAMYQPPVPTPRPAINGSRPGDISYLTMETPDTGKTRAFYAAVLGWTYEAGRVEDGWSVTNTSPMLGLWGKPGVRPTVVPMYRVDGIERAVERVRAAGGTSTDVDRTQHYGPTAECVDDQGTRFYLGEH